MTRSGSRIWSPDHESALIGIIQVAAGHPDGIAGALGHNNRAEWVRRNIDAIFHEDGPMGRFIPLSAQVFQRHLGAAQRLAQSMYTREHSNDPSGARHEDIPVWIQHYFRLFVAMENQDSSSQRAAQTRTEQATVVASLIGRQAPLGSGNDRLAEL